MERKRFPSGKRLVVSLALLTFLSGCARVLEEFTEPPARKAAHEHLAQGQRLFDRGEYKAAFKQNEKALFLAGANQPADRALFNMGLISAHSENSAKDYPKAQLTFERVIREFPDGYFAEPAKAWVQVLKEHQKISQEKETLKREKQALLQERAALIREKEKMTQAMEQSRKVDLEIEKKRRKKRQP